jgi:hypothetical protein
VGDCPSAPALIGARCLLPPHEFRAAAAEAISHGAISAASSGRPLVGRLSGLESR